jgi:hypothetical protein
MLGAFPSTHVACVQCGKAASFPIMVFQESTLAALASRMPRVDVGGRGRLSEYPGSLNLTLALQGR